MGRLDVEIERSRDRVLPVGDRLEGRPYAVDERALELVRVLLEERVAEDPDRLRIRLELLHDQVVVLAGFHVGPILADRMGDRLESLLVLRVQGLEHRDRPRTALHGDLDEGIPRPRGRRRAEDLDLRVRQCLVDVAPAFVGIGDELAVDRHLLRQREKDLLERELRLGRLLRAREHDAVEADPDLDDLCHAIGGAQLDLRRLDAPGRVRDVGRLRPRPLTEELEPAARAGALDDRRLEAPCPAEALGDGRREGEHGRGAHDVDLVPSVRRHGDLAERKHGEQGHEAAEAGCHRAFPFADPWRCGAKLRAPCAFARKPR